MDDLCKREDFIKDYLDPKSPDFFEWDMVSVATIFKEEFQAEESEHGVIQGYANAVNCIAIAISTQNHTRGIMTLLRNDSMVIPFIFLARHTTELVLKYVSKYLGLQTPNKHGLLQLWDKIESIVTSHDSSSKEEMGIMRIFISALEELDPDGSHARYSKNNQGNLYHNKPKHINVQKINRFLQQGILPLIECKEIEREIHESSDKEEN